MKVDETIKNFRTELKDEYKISQYVSFLSMRSTPYQVFRAFNSLYQKDKLEYGDPADSSHQAVEPKDVVSWQSTVNMQAAQVQGRTKKRRRVD